MILVDLDHFKQFNDTYGHLAGDDCLVRVARALRDVGCRPRDVVARFGGEEFVILLPETHATSARQMAERCRTAIESLAIPHETSWPGFSIPPSRTGGTASSPTADLTGQKASFSPGRGQAAAISRPWPDTVIQAVCMSAPPKQMLVQ